MSVHNVEIEDFYHHDFTTASDWEVFIARLEEIIHEWKLMHTKFESNVKQCNLIDSNWKEQSEEVNFADVGFTFKHYKLHIEKENENITDDNESSQIQTNIDSFNQLNDIDKNVQDYLLIAQYYGIHEFLILVPTKKTGISDETKIKILLSSLTIASNNAKSEIPAFVQVQEPWQKYYLGIGVGRGLSTHFEMVHLKKTPSHCRHLTGLIAIFKQKIGEKSTIKLDPIKISVRFSYSLTDWTNYTWTQEPPDFELMQGETIGATELGKLPFGASFDPIAELELFTTWPQICENVVVDSESFTDLEPQLAPEWSARVKMIQTPACLLGEYLTDFLAMCHNEKNLVDVLGNSAAYLDNGDQILCTAFDALTESKIPPISKVMSKASSKKSSKNVDGPIPEDVMIQILYFLFPDADQKRNVPYGDVNGYNIDDELCKGIKTCVPNGLVWRLSIVAAHCTHNLGGANALAQLWHEFVQEIRFRWEQSILIPGMAAGFPDSVRTCLLHQKLQMINCCIERKKNREANAYKQQNANDDLDSESEEEFFECTEEEAVKQEELQIKKTQQKSKQLIWNRPKGRLAKHPSLRLLNNSDALYLPVTQDPVPKTEDQLEEDAEVMMQLGTDKHASEMRAKLMSASLLSDMESFKAANPGSELEDFIRWYSPRDWIETDATDKSGQKTGNLSPRMKIPNNPWATTWKSAQPVPAHQQRRLFDDTREAEKAVHYLASKNLGQISRLLLPVLTHAALYTLSEQKQDALPALSDVIQSILNKLQYATKSIHQTLKLYEEISKDIESVEALVAQINSLYHKLCSDNNSNELTSFIIQLMRGKEVIVPSGSRGTVGKRIIAMFRDAQKANLMMNLTSSTNENMSQEKNKKMLPEPTCKEFILRAVSPTIPPQTHRLYACLKKDCFRLAGLFSEDTTFL
ncbi:hypothetical protein HCN44_007833 [Aphidius gifuensis]|uniref:Rab3 GTPase-activating protein catalytic subunit n=1 Tax=Aphidius gifuensis TaxID=684658 RepID=A0A834XQX2_APHGI|nr:rab3 GTPase-activating protein catalytic subunit isoform X2 [Aphidius gifuensis]KAF7989236.1 hypothetical protein HCN44_007833 [Aphidius gifuensis]